MFACSPESPTTPGCIFVRARSIKKLKRHPLQPTVDSNAFLVVAKVAVERLVGSAERSDTSAIGEGKDERSRVTAATLSEAQDNFRVADNTPAVVV
jgi:hypothetical protein